MQKVYIFVLVVLLLTGRLQADQGLYTNFQSPFAVSSQESASGITITNTSGASALVTGMYIQAAYGSWDCSSNAVDGAEIYGYGMQWLATNFNNNQSSSIGATYLYNMFSYFLTNAQLELGGDENTPGSDAGGGAGVWCIKLGLIDVAGNNLGVGQTIPQLPFALVNLPTYDYTLLDSLQTQRIRIQCTNATASASGTCFSVGPAYPATASSPPANPLSYTQNFPQKTGQSLVWKLHENNASKDFYSHAKLTIPSSAHSRRLSAPFKDSPSGITIKNNSGASKVITGLFIQSVAQDTSAGHNCSSTTAYNSPGSQGYGMIWSTVSFSSSGSGQTVNMGRNFLYNVMFNFMTITGEKTDNNSGTPGSGFAGNAGHYWCVQLGVTNVAATFVPATITNVASVSVIPINCTDPYYNSSSDFSVGTCTGSGEQGFVAP